MHSPRRPSSHMFFLSNLIHVVLIKRNTHVVFFLSNLIHKSFLGGIRGLLDDQVCNLIEEKEKSNI